MAREPKIAGALLIVAVAAGAWMFWQASTSLATAAVPIGNSPSVGRIGAHDESSKAASSNAVAFGSPQALEETSHVATPPAQIGLKPLTIEQERRLQAFVDSGARHNAD